MSTSYPVALARDESGELRAVFRDLPEILTWGEDEAEALAAAADALEVAVGGLMDRGRDVPPPSPPVPGEHLVVLPAQLAAKLAVWRAWRENGISKSELARRLGITETEARRILDPKHATKLPTLDAAARALGKRLVVDLEAA